MKKALFFLLVLSYISCLPDNKIPENFDYGITQKGLYTNDYFGLTVPFDTSWVIQSQEQTEFLIEEGQNMISGDDQKMKKLIEASKVNTAYLLTSFKYELGTPVLFNPSFMIVAENTKNFPGIENGGDYITHAKSLLQQSPAEYKFDKEIYTRKLGTRDFHVMETSITIQGQKVFQEYLSTVDRGFSISFIISYSNEEEQNELYQVLDAIKY